MTSELEKDIYKKLRSVVAQQFKEVVGTRDASLIEGEELENFLNAAMTASTVSFMDQVVNVLLLMEQESRQSYLANFLEVVELRIYNNVKDQMKKIEASDLKYLN